MTRMTPSEAFVETMVANGVSTTFGIMGSAFMDAMDIFAPAGIDHRSRWCTSRALPTWPMATPASAAVTACVIGQNGPGISNCVTAIAAAYWAHTPGSHRHPGDRHHGHGPGWLPGSQPAADVPGVHQVPGTRQQPEPHGRVHRPLLRPRHVRDGPHPAEYSARLLLWRIDVDDPAADAPRPRSRRRQASLDEAADLLAQAKFPVILSGGGVVMADAVEECKALAERLGCTGGQQLPAQRLLPGQPPAVVRSRWATRAPRRR